jgi:hypothetical protein
LNGSEAIDAGDSNVSEAYALAFDQRGRDRTVDRDGDFIHEADIGAFELAADEYFGEV